MVNEGHPPTWGNHVCPQCGEVTSWIHVALPSHWTASTWVPICKNSECSLSKIFQADEKKRDG